MYYTCIAASGAESLRKDQSVLMFSGVCVCVCVPFVCTDACVFVRGVTLEVRSLWKMPLLCRYCSPRATSRARLSRRLHDRYMSLPNSCSRLPPLMYWIINGKGVNYTQISTR